MPDPMEGVFTGVQPQIVPCEGDMPSTVSPAPPLDVDHGNAYAAYVGESDGDGDSDDRK